MPTYPEKLVHFIRDISEKETFGLVVIKPAMLGDLGDELYQLLNHIGTQSNRSHQILQYIVSCTSDWRRCASNPQYGLQGLRVEQ